MRGACFSSGPTVVEVLGRLFVGTRAVPYEADAARFNYPFLRHLGSLSVFIRGLSPRSWDSYSRFALGFRLCLRRERNATRPSLPPSSSAVENFSVRDRGLHRNLFGKGMRETRRAKASFTVPIAGAWALMLEPCGRSNSSVAGAARRRRGERKGRRTGSLWYPFPFF